MGVGDVVVLIIVDVPASFFLFPVGFAGAAVAEVEASVPPAVAVAVVESALEAAPGAEAGAVPGVAAAGAGSVVAVDVGAPAAAFVATAVAAVAAAVAFGALDCAALADVGGTGREFRRAAVSDVPGPAGGAAPSSRPWALEAG